MCHHLYALPPASTQLTKKKPLDATPPGMEACVIYPYSILNYAPNFHSYFTLWCFRCLPIPYSDVFLFHTLMFLTFPTVFRHLSALRCFPYSDVSKILLFHSIPSPCSDIFRCFPHFYRCGTFLVTSQTLFLKHHNLGSIMDSLLHVTIYILPFIYYSIDIHPL